MNKHLSNKVIVFTAAMSIAVAVLIFFLGVTNHTFCGVRADNFRGMLSIGFGLGCIPFIPVHCRCTGRIDVQFISVSIHVMETVSGGNRSGWCGHSNK